MCVFNGDGRGNERGKGGQGGGKMGGKQGGGGGTSRSVGEEAREGGTWSCMTTRRRSMCGPEHTI